MIPRTGALVLAMLLAVLLHGQYSINVDSLRRAYPKARDPLKRLEIAWWLSRCSEAEISKQYAKKTIALADSLLGNGYAGDYDIQTKKGSGLWNVGRGHDNAGQVDSAIVWYQRARDLWAHIGNDERVLFADGRLAALMSQSGQVSEAITILEGIVLRHEELHDTMNLASDHQSLGAAYLVHANYAKALDHYLLAVRFAGRVNNDYARSLLAATLDGIGLIYHDLGQADSALVYYRKALAAEPQPSDPEHPSANWMNISSVLYEQGDTLQAAAALDSALALLRPEGSPIYRAMIYPIWAKRLLQEGMKDSALHVSRLGVYHAERLGQPNKLVRCKTNLGWLLHSLHRYPEALEVLKEASAIAHTTTIEMRERRGLAEQLYHLYTAMDRPKEALAAYQDYAALNDSVESDDNRRRLHYYDLRRQQQADSLKAREERDRLTAAHGTELSGERNRKLLYLFGGLGVAVIAGGLWWRLGRTRMEKARSEEILYSVLPEEVAKEIRRTGSAQSREIDQVSILFTDFKGFTELSARISRQELMNELNVCFRAFDGIIGPHGVEKIKTIGDSYMAAAGLKREVTGSATSTVRAALEMQAFITQRKVERDQQGLPAFQMRVGIHTGPVVAGIVGVKKFQYDIWGDTVNTASRMESSGEVGQVNISEATYALVKDVPGLAFTPRGKVQAKGKGEMEMYFVETQTA